MAIKLPKFFSTADTKSRVFLILATMVFIGLVIFFGARFLGNTGNAVGPSRVATAPADLQSVPGSANLTAQYSEALQQRNIQAAQSAQMTGGSAVPTLIATPGSQTSGNCTVLCPGEDNPNIVNDINNLVNAGKLSQDDANRLLDLANKNVSADEYAAALDDLVKQGKLTPEQARQLLATYKKQHDNNLLADSGRMMDAMIKSGQLPLDTANQLLLLQKSKVTPAEYAAELNRLVKQGKLTPQAAAQLLAQYSQQQAAEATKRSLFGLKQLAKSGTITPEVADDLANLQTKNVPVDQYAAELQRLVAAGKLTPAAAAKLLEQYKAKRAAGNLGALDTVVSQAEAAGRAQLSNLVAQGKLSQADANSLQALQDQDVSPEDYQKALEALVKAGKLSPADAQKLLDNYKKLHAVRGEAKQLVQLQGNNASPTDYTNELKQAVQAGLLTPDQAASLLQEYQIMSMPAQLPAGPGVESKLPTTSDFAQLQAAFQTPSTAVPITPAEESPAQQQFAAAAAESQADALQARQQRIQQLQAAMANQAQSLLTAWQPQKMQHQSGVAPDKKILTTSTQQKKGGKNGEGANADGTPGGRPLIKAGSIYFATLDTAVDSDYPDTPVLATIIQGPFKGAKLLGKLSLAKGMDKVSLNFNLMDMDQWLRTKSINAFAIDPDTARTVMASSVDHHYLMRYGSLFASSFMTGYAAGIQNEGTSTTGIFGTSTSHPALSPGNKIAVGLGQVGTALSNVTASYFNTPTTVRVNAGVGIGVLFMATVEQ